VLVDAGLLLLDAESGELAAHPVRSGTGADVAAAFKAEWIVPCSATAPSFATRTFVRVVRNCGSLTLTGTILVTLEGGRAALTWRESSWRCRRGSRSVSVRCLSMGCSWSVRSSH
jgi:hypothetical protein